jgi:hypothetical protein
MIKRYSPRPSRRPLQDFHFFAAPDPIANLESQFARAPQPAQPPPQPPPAPEPSQQFDPPQAPLQPPPQIFDPPAAPSRTIVKLYGPAERAAEAALAAAELREAERRAAAAPARKPRSKSRKRKRSTARLATPRRNHAKPKPKPLSATDTRSDHERHCTICSHSDRADIENAFMHWHSIGDMADEYDVSRSAIYRHAYAAGLFSRRNRNLRFALGHLVERVQDVEPTADSVVRAMHAFARVNDEGEWIEPPAHVIVSSGGIRREAAAGPSRRPISIPLDSDAISDVIDVTPDPALPAAPSAPLSFSALPSPAGEPLNSGVLPGTVTRVETDATR